MLKIATQAQIQDYYNHPGISQSFLKSLAGDLSLINVKKESDSFVFGKLVDAMLLGTKEDFQKEYHISELTVLPSDTMQLMIKKLVEIVKEDYIEQINVIESPIDNAIVMDQAELFVENTNDSFVTFAEIMSNFEHYIVAITQEFNYQPRWGDQAKISNFLKEKDYYLDLVKAEGKIVISSEVYSQAVTFCDNLRNHPRTSRFFDVENLSLNPDVEVYYQLPIYFEYEGLSCKALLDIVFVEHISLGTVKVTPIDLKSMHGNTYNFPQQVYNYRYDIQAAWYTLALKKWFSDCEAIVLPFMFVVNSSTLLNKPLCFQLSESVIEGGKIGFTKYSKFQKGYLALLEDYKFYAQNGFQEEKEIVVSGNSPLILTHEGYEVRVD